MFFRCCCLLSYIHIALFQFTYQLFSETLRWIINGHNSSIIHRVSLLLSTPISSQYQYLATRAFYAKPIDILQQIFSNIIYYIILTAYYITFSFSTSSAGSVSRVRHIHIHTHIIRTFESRMGYFSSVFAKWKCINLYCNRSKGSDVPRMMRIYGDVVSHAVNTHRRLKCTVIAIASYAMSELSSVSVSILFVKVLFRRFCMLERRCACADFGQWRRTKCTIASTRPLV